MTTTLCAAFTTTVGMIDRVHGSAADGRANPHPPLAAGLAQHDVHVFRVADGADRGAARGRHAANFAGRQRELRPLGLAGHEHRRRTS